MTEQDLQEMALHANKLEIALKKQRSFEQCTMEEIVEVRRNLRNLRASIVRWSKMPIQEMTLHCGELTMSEVRTVRAILKNILNQKNETLSH